MPSVKGPTPRGVAGVGLHVGEVPEDFQPPRGEEGRPHADRNHILGGMAAGRHMGHAALEFKRAGYHARPKIERLPDVAKIGCLCRLAVGLEQFEPHPAQVQTMRRAAIPIASCLDPRLVLRRPLRIRHHTAGVHGFAAVAADKFPQGFLLSKSLRVRKGMPAPIRERSHRVVKRLETGRIDRKGKLAVAHLNRIPKVVGFERNVVPRDQRVSVNAGNIFLRPMRRAADGKPKRQECQQNALECHPQFLS